MASGSQADIDAGGGRSGGKILKRRRTAARKTPYDRPTSSLQQESPSWYNGLVLPAKFVAGGASKLLSSFWNPKSWGSPSSSSDSDSDSEDVTEDDYEDNENHSDGAAELDQKKDSSSGKSEVLYLVEKLLMLERYSREECDRLIEIINSRVVDYTIGERVDVGPSTIMSRETPNIRNRAVMEAKELITRNMVGSSLRSDLDDNIHGSKSVMMPHITKGEVGSPVDVAKSYMRTRPPWISPIRHSDPPTPSPLTADLLKEGTAYSSVDGDSFSSAKRGYLSAGSWNIQDEVRRLRSQATENMLSNHRSTKLPAFTVENDFSERSPANDEAIEVMELNKPVSLEAPKPEDGTVNLASQGACPGSSDIRTTQDDVPIEALSPLPTIQEQNQMVDGQDAVSKNSPDAVLRYSKQNPRRSDEVISLEQEESIGQSGERNLDQERSDKVDKTADDASRIKGHSDFVTESTEVSNVNEAIGNVNGSQGGSNTNNSSFTREGDSPTVKRSVTKRGRYYRRGRGRGK